MSAVFICRICRLPLANVEKAHEHQKKTGHEFIRDRKYDGGESGDFMRVKKEEKEIIK